MGVSHSIKARKWLKPGNYETFGNWKEVAAKSRQRGALFDEYCIHVQDRNDDAKPSAIVLEHLAKEAGAQIVDKKWKPKTLRKKKQRDFVEDDDESKSEIESESDDDEDDKKKRKRKRKKKKKHFKKVIISHPEIYKKLKLKKRESVRVVTAQWIFDCIERYEVVPF